MGDSINHKMRKLMSHCMRRAEYILRIQNAAKPTVMKEKYGTDGWIDAMPETVAYYIIFVINIFYSTVIIWASLN